MFFCILLALCGKLIWIINEHGTLLLRCLVVGWYMSNDFFPAIDTQFEVVNEFTYSKHASYDNHNVELIAYVVSINLVLMRIIDLPWHCDAKVHSAVSRQQ